jgi:O-antigen biosynthesis protein WbqP
MTVEARSDIAGYKYEGVQNYITKTGAFIRKYSIDELPQLLNILLFQMSLIGYRPSQTCEKDLNEARNTYGLYQLRPGISGWAQVNGRDILAANPTKKAELDAYYLQHFPFGLDVKIFFRTIVVLLKHKDVVEGVLDQVTNDQGTSLEKRDIIEK